MKTLKGFFLLLFFCFLLLNCKKKKDEEIPEIVISSPSVGDKFEENGNVDFIVKVKDNFVIESIKANIVDVDKKPLSATITVFPKVKSFEWKNYLTIDDTKIDVSGTYYLNIKASDGINEESIFLAIFISENILHKKAIFIVSNEFAKGVEIQKLDSVNNLSFFTKLTGDYLASAVSSKNKQLFICGNYEGPFRAIDTKTGVVQWKYDTPLNNSRYFTALHVSKNEVYIGFYEGFFQGYNQKGELIFLSKNLGERNYFTEIIYKNYNKILIFERHKSEAKKRLKTYYLNGNSKQEIFVDFEPISILSYQENTCFILANKNDKAMIYVFDLESNSYFNPTFISGKITCATKAENKVVFCNGVSLLVYDIETNAVINFKENFIANKLEYDVTNNELIVLNNGTIYLLDFASGNIKKSIAVNSKASDILLQLSK